MEEANYTHVKAEAVQSVFKVRTSLFQFFLCSLSCPPERYSAVRQVAAHKTLICVFFCMDFIWMFACKCHSSVVRSWGEKAQLTGGDERKQEDRVGNKNMEYVRWAKLKRTQDSRGAKKETKQSERRRTIWTTLGSEKDRTGSTGAKRSRTES